MTTDELIHLVRWRRELPPPAERYRLRTEAGLTLRQVGAAIGVSHTAVQSWERGAIPKQGEHLFSYVMFLKDLSALEQETP